MFSLGYIEHDPEKTSAGTVVSGKAGLEEHDLPGGMVAVVSAALVKLNAAVGQKLKIRAHMDVGQCGSGQLEHGLAQHVLPGHAGEIQEGLVAAEVSAVRPLVEDGNGGHLDKLLRELQLPLQLGLLLIQLVEELVEGLAQNPYFVTGLDNDRSGVLALALSELPDLLGEGNERRREVLHAQPNDECGGEQHHY